MTIGESISYLYELMHQHFEEMVNSMSTANSDVHFTKVMKFIGIKLFINLPFYSFNVCGIWRHVPSFIYDIGHNVFSLFVFIGLAKSYKFY